MFPDGEPLMTDLYNEEVSLHNQKIPFYLNLELQSSFRCKIYFEVYYQFKLHSKNDGTLKCFIKNLYEFILPMIYV